MAPRPLGGWLPLLFLGVALALPLALLERRPGATAYCADCALQRQTETWGMRGLPGVALGRRVRETPTLVSGVLTQKRLVGPHAHRWLEPRVVPNPLNVWGPPVVVSLGFLNTPLVAGLLTNVADFADPTSRENARELVLRPEYSYLVNHSLRFHRFPAHGFRDRDGFLAWWGQNAFSFYQHLREETEPD